MKLDFSDQRLLGEAIVFRSPSSTRQGVFHYTFKLRHGGFLCTCEGWQYQGHCKHVTAAQTDSPEAQEIMKGWRSANTDRTESGRIPPNEVSRSPRPTST